MKNNISFSRFVLLVDEELTTNDYPDNAVNVKPVFCVAICIMILFAMIATRRFRVKKKLSAVIFVVMTLLVIAFVILLAEYSDNFVIHLPIVYIFSVNFK